MSSSSALWDMRSANLAKPQMYPLITVLIIRLDSGVNVQILFFWTAV